MRDQFLKFLAIIALLAVIVSFIMAVIAAIGSMKITDGCLYRYNVSGDNTNQSNSDLMTSTINLRADANNTAIDNSTNSEVIIERDPDNYGKWLNTKVPAVAGQKIKLKITGEISLCQAYIPKNNLQQASDLDNNGNRVKIPRVSDPVNPVPLIFDAKTDEWRNIAEIYANDQIIISISRDQQGNVGSDGDIIPGTAENVSMQNIFKVTNDGTPGIITADCSEGKRVYVPICGRYSIYYGPYVDHCKSDTYRCGGYEKCCLGLVDLFGAGCVDGEDAFGTCWGSRQRVCDNKRCSYNKTIRLAAPAPYRYDGYYTSLWYDNINQLIRNYNVYECFHDPKGNIEACHNDREITEQDKAIIENTEPGGYQKTLYFWFSANDATGLLYRLDTSEAPTAPKSRGTSYKFAKILSDADINSISSDKKNNFIINNTNPDAPKPIYYYVQKPTNAPIYLQYRFHANDSQFANNTGGYVLNIKQTKCRRINGVSMTDVHFADRGRIKYGVIPYDQDPNEPNSNFQFDDIIPDVDGNAYITVPSDKSGYLWMKIYNAQDDYQYSFGQYQVQFFTSQNTGSFIALILSPLLDTLKGKVKDASEMIFKNMTCYDGDPNKDYKITSCTNFFSYIKAILTLYIMVYAAMFLLGMVQISQTDLVIRVIKIGIVAGLMSHKTFDFFSSYVFDFVTGFSDQMIANMSGYSSMFSTGGEGVSITGISSGGALETTKKQISNPMMFLESLMTRVFLSQTFMSQILALISMGISGILYFIIIFIALAITIITVFRAIAIYIMAFLAIAVLISLTPLFLTFMLFDFTRYLFDNWIRFAFRYMMEPVVLMAGIIVLTQLFTIYLDYAIGYSVCWKCALPIKLPFPNIPGFNPAFANVELFCINWFAPWGFDHRSGMMGVNMQHIIALVIIAYCMYGYTELSGQIVGKLTGNSGASATQMGNTMSSKMEDSALKKVGLDANSRAQIKAGIEQRLKGRESALKKGQKEARKGPKTDSQKPKKQEGSRTDSEESSITEDGE